MKILLIEDDASIRNVLKMSFCSEGFVVDTSDNGEDGSFMARTNDYDIIILDNMLPRKNGHEVCEEIRKAGKNMPVLILSAKSEVLEKIKLFEAGVDDYVTKPFSFEELKSRIKNLLRRPAQIVEKNIIIDDLELDTNSVQVFKKGKEIYLTKKEFSILEILMKNKENIVTRGTLWERVWDINSDPFSNTIEAHILNLRKKLGDNKKRIIRNIPGRGYKITDQKC